MGTLFWIIVALVFILTGAIIPILHFGLWAVVVILAIVLFGWIVLKAFGLVIRPLALIGWDIAGAIQGNGYPKSDDPDYKHYVDWANRTGEFSRYKEWIHVKNVLAERRRLDADRQAWVRKDQQRRQNEKI